MPRSLFASYPSTPDRYDEMRDAHGRIRPHWQALLQQLEGMPPELMRPRIEFVARTIRENGVTFNVYADPENPDRPWSLDPLPLMIPAETWHMLSRAVAQRAQLLNAILADLYGPQHLLSEGLLPPALIYGQHGYLWPCRGSQPPGGIWLHHYAVDLGRSPDGAWWVMADRTQAPSGAGYALENRTIVSRVFPELFHDLRVQHLASYFQEMLHSMSYWAPVDAGERPFVVLLTPGPYHETYFEHSYLARYLGYPLVEGKDLTVRGDTVYLRTLTGLQRVHAILRRQNDDYCDPLELRGDSTLGVPGLLQAIRAGRVLVSNAFGSGLLGSGALMGFLPAIAQRLLGESLHLPSVATWWCGEQAAERHVLTHLDHLVIKPAYPTQRFNAVFGHEMHGSARDDLVRRIRARPHAYLAQELVKLSQAPVWRADPQPQLQPRSVGLRLYATATPHGYQVMPGGLSRVASQAHALVMSMQRGGSSKDIWVLTEDPVNTFSLLRPTVGKADLVRSNPNLSSRLVENLYWFARYAERFDNTARLLRVALTRWLDEASSDPGPELTTLLALCTTSDPAEPLAADPRTCLLDAMFDSTHPASLVAVIRQLLWSAGQMRTRLSLDHWHALNRLQHQWQQTRTVRHDPTEALAFLDQVLLVSSSLTGFAMDNMTRDHGWRLLMVGRRIERLNFLARTVATALQRLPPLPDPDLDWLLELTDSIITYRSRYSRHPEWLSVLDLLVFDDSNPHALMFQVQGIQRYLERIGRDLGELPMPDFDQARQQCSSFDLDQILQDRVAGCADLAGKLLQLKTASHALSDALEMRFFTHVGAIAQQTLAR